MGSTTYDEDGVEQLALLGLGGTGIHNDLFGRSDPDCHPISAITGLTAQILDFETRISANEALLVNHETRILALEAIDHDWLNLVAQSANPGTVPANTLWQDDGSNFTALSMVWGEPVTNPNPSVFGTDFSIGDPGTEQGGINIGGVNYDANAKVNSVGGTLDATLILHRHSVSFPPILTFARTNDDTTGHTAVTTGQTLGSLIYSGWSATHYDIAAVLDVRVPTGTTVSATSLAAEMVFFTVPDLSNTAAIAMIIGSDQIIYGDDVAGGILDLQGAAHNAPDTGIVRSNSPITITYDTISNTTPAEAFAVRWNPTFTASLAYIGGFLTVAPIVTITTGTFIPATFSDTSSMLTAANPGFSAFTFINELAVIENSGNFNLMSALVMNIGLTHERNSSGTSTTPGSTAISASFQTRATVSGAVITKTAQTAVRFSPTYSTVGGSTANLGTMVGLDLFQPAVALFQPGAGAETMVAYNGLRFPNFTFGGASATISVILSTLNFGTNKRFLNHTGNADSRIRGQFRIDVDNVGVWYGAGADVVTYWNGTNNAYRVQFALNVTSLLMSNPASGRILWDCSIVDNEFNFNCNRFSLGAGTGAVGNQVGNFIAPARTVGVPGGWADFLLTQAGSLTLGGAAMSDVSAWVINAISIASSTGSITELATLRVGGMTTSNPGITVTERASLWVRGRHMQEGSVQYEPINPAALNSGNNNNWAGLLTGSASNNTRYWARITGNATTSVLTGIDATAVQDGDTFELTNVGTEGIDITNEDTASTAANRIITIHQGTYLLDEGETVTMRYDSTTARWRQTTGTVPTAGLLSAEYRFSTSTTAADPGAGRLRYNNATPASVTAVYVDQFTANGFDAQNMLVALASGDQIYIQNETDASEFLLMDITSVVDNTGWFTINGTIGASGGLPANNRSLVVSLRFA